MSEHDLLRIGSPSLAQWKMVYEQSPVGIGFLDKNGKWLKANRTLCSMLEYVEWELVHKDFQDMSHPEDVEPDVEMRLRLTGGEIPGYEIIKRLLTKTNKILWTKQSVSPVLDDKGHIVCLVAHVQPYFTESAKIEKEVDGRLNLRPTLNVNEFVADNWKAMIAFAITISSTLIMIGVAFWGMVEKVNILSDQVTQQGTLLVELIKDDISITKGGLHKQDKPDDPNGVGPSE